MAVSHVDGPLHLGPGLDIVRDVAGLRGRIGGWRDAGLSVALIPTMGALHAGHLALVGEAHRLADRVAVSVFVNPTQFGPNEDFAVYPRDEAGDAARLVTAGAHLMFAPEVAEMYPPGSLTRVTVPGLGERLEGEFRPGFFTGVATVVTKLLLQALPDVALFGEKDWQQLQVIRRVVRDLAIPVTIHGCPTVREADGLALSSRNAYLSADERAVAPALHRTLQDVAAAIGGGGDPVAACRGGSEALLAAGFRQVGYLAVCDPETLVPWQPPEGEAPLRAARILAAAWLGKTRLIDNLGVE